MRLVMKTNRAADRGQSPVVRNRPSGCCPHKGSTPLPLIWRLPVGWLLIAAVAGGCSREQQPAEERPQPALETVDPRPQDQAAGLDRAADSSSPALEPAGDAASEDLAPSSDRPQSLQAALDNEPPPVDGDTMLAELGYVSPSDKVRAALADPPGATRLSQKSSLWVDVKGKRVFADGYIAQREAYLEMFACPAETKEHESIVGVLAQSEEVHAALLAVGAKQGTPVRFDTEYIPATGQPIRIWVMWYDEQGQFQTTDARRWVRHVGTEDSLKLDWVFVGSSLWKDPTDGRVYYQANAGEMICVSNFSTALMDLPVESSDANNQLLFDAFTPRIPPQGTPVRLMLVPIAESEPAEEEAAEPATAAEQPPTVELMPRKDAGAAGPATSGAPAA